MLRHANVTELPLQDCVREYPYVYMHVFTHTFKYIFGFVHVHLVRMMFRANCCKNEPVWEILSHTWKVYNKGIENQNSPFFATSAHGRVHHHGVAVLQKLRKTEFISGKIHHFIFKHLLRFYPYKIHGKCTCC